MCYTQDWIILIKRCYKMDFYNKKIQQKISAVIVIVIVVALVATSILPYF